MAASRISVHDKRSLLPEKPEVVASLRVRVRVRATTSVVTWP